ncbi:CLUMA_CG002460, isoform A [Clunio marinus]|uniref:CLUMA_CG002460, isoform A n=1 Tax=Clunio marinus TaxID=568069 RepID=A0A1J1HKK5_9DIPT|nr:CLUMA_CG002460, isoform A [Clunio marinus]
MNGKDIDLCKFLDGSDGILALTDVLSGSAESKMTTFPEATYKIILKFYNNEDDKIVEVTMICTSKNV